MIGAAKHKKKTTKDIPTLKNVDCPSCGKHRLLKYANDDGTVTPASNETVEVRDTQRYLEVCEFCSIKYQREDEKFARDNLRKLAKALQADNLPEDGEDEGGSDHRDFSLN